MGRRFQHHLVLVGLGEDGGDEPLPQGIIEGIVNVAHAHAVAAGRIPVNGKPEHAAHALHVAGHVGKLGLAVQGCHQAGQPGFQRLPVQGLHTELVLGAGHAVLDGQVLHGLHIERQAGLLLCPGHDAPGNGRGARVTVRQRLEVHRQAGGAQTGIDAVHAHLKDHAFHGGVLQNDVRQHALPRGHGRKGRILRRFGNALQDPGILRGKEALGHHHVEDDGQHQRAHGHRERQALMGQHPVQLAGIPVQQAGKEAPCRALPAAAGLPVMIGPQHDGAKHGRERQGNDGGNEDGHGQRHGELAEQPAGHIPHEQQGNEHGHQGKRQGNDGKADLPCPAQGRRHGLHAFLEIAGNILDDHNGVVHHKTRGNNQSHERQIVE